jgi:molybdenum cofactor biosynthesis protein B
MVVESHRRLAGDAALGFAIVTVSDSRTEATDAGGRRLRELVEAGRHRVASATIVRDEESAIRAVVESMLAVDEVDVVLLTGGTGVSPRDVTVEAIRPLLEKEVAGFGELFRMLSYSEVGSAAMLSRACGGIARGRAIFLLPGSPAALELAMTRLILPEAAHLVTQARRAGS